MGLVSLWGMAMFNLYLSSNIVNVFNGNEWDNPCDKRQLNFSIEETNNITVLIDLDTYIINAVVIVDDNKSIDIQDVFDHLLVMMYQNIKRMDIYSYIHDFGNYNYKDSFELYKITNENNTLSSEIVHNFKKILKSELAKQTPISTLSEINVTSLANACFSATSIWNNTPQLKLNNLTPLDRLKQVYGHKVMNSSRKLN